MTHVTHVTHRLMPTTCSFNNATECEALTCTCDRPLLDDLKQGRTEPDDGSCRPCSQEELCGRVAKATSRSVQECRDARIPAPHGGEWADPIS